jgi:CubicO group peptidase (beta-lactamase class C family)
MAEIAARLPLDYEPGTSSQYSSGGYTVLARVLELATGASYDSLLAREITRPLGMASTGDADGRAILPGRAAAYLPGPRGRMVAPYQDFSGLVGAGSVWSTARDMHRFVQGVVTGRLGESARQSYLRGGKLAFDGRVSGFRSFATYDSASALEAIWIGNDGSGACDVMKKDIARLAAGESVAPPVPPALAAAAPPDSALRRCEGQYRITATGTRLNVVLKDGVLWSNDWVLLPTADGDFWSPRDYGRVRPVPGADGRIARLDWIENGETYAAPRVDSTAAP